MKKKILALLVTMVILVGQLCGCSLLVTNTDRDLKQIVADVDITSAEEFNDDYAGYIGKSQVTKKELYSAYSSYGYQYVEEQSYTYEKTFELLMNSLVQRKVMLEYIKMYYFDLAASSNSAAYQAYSFDGYKTYMASAPETDKTLYELKYFVKADSDYYKEAIYNLAVNFNNTIDSYEKNVIDAEETTDEEVTLLAVPTGADATEEHFYTTNYGIYTGKNNITDCGVYEALDDSTATTRQKAYNKFLGVMKKNGLIEDDENSFDDVTTLSYYTLELTNQIEQILIEQFEEMIKEDAEALATESYVTGRYAELYAAQKSAYDASLSTFESEMDDENATSFTLYAPSNATKFGFVYNILIPFDETQTYNLTSLKNDNGLSKGTYYAMRNDMLSRIKAVDQRKTWFDKSVEYAYEAEAGSYYGSTSTPYLFFKNNFKDTKSGKYVEGIDKYYGKYAYNGSVSYDADEEKYTLNPNKLTIDGVIAELEGYLGFAGITASGSRTATYATAASEFYGADNKIDYSKFVYYTGSANVNFDWSTLLYKDATDKTAYTAMSAVRELMFAYNTDTACNSSYVGYYVNCANTSYVSEFEYAAKLVVRNGAGSYAVVATDYGWHLIYCTASLTAGELYDLNWADKDKEGTFTNMFVESIKTSISSKVLETKSAEILNTFSNENYVTIYTSRYADLVALDNN